MRGADKPVRLSLGAGLVLGAFCVAIGLGGVVGLGFMGRLAMTEWRMAYRGIEATCTVLDKRVSESRINARAVSESSPSTTFPRRPGSSSRVYRPEFRIRYEVAGAVYDLWTYDVSGFYTGRDPRPILARYEVGKRYPCWYDPKTPGAAVLVRKVQLFAYAWSLLPMIMIAIGVVGVSEVRKTVAGSQPDSASLVRRQRRGRKAAASRREPVRAGQGTRLPVRLARLTPWSRQRWLALGLGLFLVAFSTGFGMLAAAHRSEQRLSDRIAMTVILGGFGLAGLVLLYAGLHQMIAALVAETIVEVEHLEVGPGETLRVRILQPGPVALRSLNATLVRKQTESLTDDRTAESYEFHRRFFEVRDVNVGRGEILDHEVDLTIPRRAIPTGPAGRIDTTWLIEIWGRVRCFPGFMHQYELVVTPRRPRR